MKNSDTAECKGDDEGKIAGIKRYMAVTTPKVTNRQGTLLAVDRGRVLLTPVQRVLVEGGDIGAFCSELLCKAGGSVQIAQRSKLQPFSAIPKRGVVERSFA